MITSPSGCRSLSVVEPRIPRAAVPSEDAHPDEHQAAVNVRQLDGRPVSADAVLEQVRTEGAGVVTCTGIAEPLFSAWAADLWRFARTRGLELGIRRIEDVVVIFDQRWADPTPEPAGSPAPRLVFSAPRTRPVVARGRSAIGHSPLRLVAEATGLKRQANPESTCQRA